MNVLLSKYIAISIIMTLTAMGLPPVTHASSELNSQYLALTTEFHDASTLQKSWPLENYVLLRLFRAMKMQGVKLVGRIRTYELKDSLSGILNLSPRFSNAILAPSAGDGLSVKIDSVHFVVNKIPVFPGAVQTNTFGDGISIHIMKPAAVVEEVLVGDGLAIKHFLSYELGVRWRDFWHVYGNYDNTVEKQNEGVFVDDVNKMRQLRWIAQRLRSNAQEIAALNKIRDRARILNLEQESKELEKGFRLDSAEFARRNDLDNFHSAGHYEYLIDGFADFIVRAYHTNPDGALIGTAIERIAVLDMVQVSPILQAAIEEKRNGEAVQAAIIGVMNENPAIKAYEIYRDLMEIETAEPSAIISLALQVRQKYITADKRVRAIWNHAFGPMEGLALTGDGVKAAMALAHFMQAAVNPTRAGASLIEGSVASLSFYSPLMQRHLRRRLTELAQEIEGSSKGSGLLKQWHYEAVSSPHVSRKTIRLIQRFVTHPEETNPSGQIIRYALYALSDLKPQAVLPTIMQALERGRSNQKLAKLVSNGIRSAFLRYEDVLSDREMRDKAREADGGTLAASTSAARTQRLKLASTVDMHHGPDEFIFFGSLAFLSWCRRTGDGGDEYGQGP